MGGQLCKPGTHPGFAFVFPPAASVGKAKNLPQFDTSRNHQNMSQWFSLRTYNFFHQAPTPSSCWLLFLRPWWQTQAELSWANSLNEKGVNHPVVYPIGANCNELTDRVGGVGGTSSLMMNCPVALQFSQQHEVPPPQTKTKRTPWNNPGS